MIKKVNPHYATVVLLGLIMFSSNFLSPQLFTGEILNFAVWFILSIFAFSCGWIIDKTLGWRYGGKLVFAVIVATSIMSVFLVTFFRGYFGINDYLTENFILYSLRNIMLGVMGIFGLAVAELLALQRDVEQLKHQTQLNRKIAEDAEREAEIIIREAKSKADSLMVTAERESLELINRKKEIELQLKEFLKTEKELLKKYESD
ncbi:hypothetical protein ASZ90_004265 [hydrocarbon metagenome]|uniref:Uncharacterized protein n=1 Tax=hydrocarbon metagenome TaxID=938273 RepID=A0A0W8FYF8_9ZZZZ